MSATFAAERAPRGESFRATPWQPHFRGRFAFNMTAFGASRAASWSRSSTLVNDLNGFVIEFICYIGVGGGGKPRQMPRTRQSHACGLLVRDSKFHQSQRPRMGIDGTSDGALAATERVTRFRGSSYANCQRFSGDAKIIHL